jgi:signal peptidase I
VAQRTAVKGVEVIPPGSSFPASDMEDTRDLSTLRPLEEPEKRGGLRSMLPTIRFVVLCAALFFGIRTVAPTYAIEGESMAPTFHNGGRVILNGTYRFRAPHRGDIVVFHPPVPSQEPYIKRVIGLPGDHVSIRNGLVFINDQALNEGYLNGDPTSCYHPTFCELTVPQDAVFVLGDNRANSSDSRMFGVVPIDNIIGDVVVTIWPPGAASVGP